MELWTGLSSGSEGAAEKTAGILAICDVRRRFRNAG